MDDAPSGVQLVVLMEEGDYGASGVLLSERESITNDDDTGLSCSRKCDTNKVGAGL